jgi:hypothetical protein
VYTQHAVPAARAGAGTGALLPRLVGNAPNLLPRLVRAAPLLMPRAPRRPVFLLGCGRSGKTVLAELLGAHPQVALYPGEANDLWHPRLYPWRYSPHRDAVPPIWVDPLAFAAGSARVRTARDVRALKATFGAYQMLARKPVFVNESALTAVLLPFIRAEFSEARIVHMVRDGRAVATAWARRQHEQITLHRELYAAAGLALGLDEVLDCCASSWNAQVLHFRDSVAAPTAPRGDVFEVRYEEFCAHPAETLERLAAWLGLDGWGAPVRTEHIENRNDADMAAVPAASLARAAARMRTGLELYGYV